MKKLLIFCIFIMVFLLNNCVSLSQFPIAAFSSGTYTTDIIPNQELGNKSGMSCADLYLGIAAYGDLSVYRVAKAAGIKKIHLVEYKVESYYIFYMNKCVIVYGE